MTYKPKNTNSSSFFANSRSNCLQVKKTTNRIRSPKSLSPLLPPLPPLPPLNIHNEFQKYKDLIKHSEIWKLLIDAKDHPYGKNAYDEERTCAYNTNGSTIKKSFPGEKGYLKSMKKALEHMLNTLGQPMTSEEYFKLHDLAISEVQDKDVNKKGYNKDQGYFYISNILPYNASETGLREWQQKKTSVWISDILASDAIEPITTFFRSGIYKYNESQRPLLPLSIEYLTENFDLTINSERLIFVPNHFPSPPHLLDTVFIEYYKMIDELNKTGTFPGCKNEDASLEDKKLEIIARICQNLDQMHLFADGNIRTIGFLLLNKFLIENDLSPTIMYDPNMLDLRSIQKIIDEIKKGQTYFQQTFFPTQQ